MMTKCKVCKEPAIMILETTEPMCRKCYNASLEGIIFICETCGNYRYTTGLESRGIRPFTSCNKCIGGAS